MVFVTEQMEFDNQLEKITSALITEAIFIWWFINQNNS